MDARRPTLLVVDDDDTREALAELLREEGYAVSTARDGAQALEVVERHPPDLVLLDIVMPRTTGLELLGSLRQRWSSAELPVIMMSAKDQSADVVAALGQGANDYVTKPLDLPVVLARVQAQLRMKRAAESARPQRLDSAAFERIAPGTLLDGRYLLEEKLGAGSFGVVFRARDEQQQRPVAIKVLKSSLGDSQEALERLRRESRAAANLRHPNAVEVHELRVTTDSVAFLVMEYLEGRSLDAELREQGALAPERTAAVVLPVLEVLAAAHARGFVHRDIKPANIFLQATPQGERIKVLDFGLAKPLGAAALEQNLTVEGSVLGSPAYMAPERLRNQSYDGRADTYSVGIMLYEMLTGRLPFVARNGDPMAVVAMQLTETPRPLRALRPELSAAVEEVVLGALAKDAAERPQASILGRQLAAALALELPPGLAPDSVSTLRLGTS
ncbi:MAG TPA: protein kinase [Thermoanaerobaculia bacterium]|nr:protein kinase [Thermoanaerobaculia bacterium]